MLPDSRLLTIAVWGMIGEDDDGHAGEGDGGGGDAAGGFRFGLVLMFGVAIRVMLT